MDQDEILQALAGALRLAASLKFRSWTCRNRQLWNRHRVAGRRPCRINPMNHTQPQGALLAGGADSIDAVISFSAFSG